MSAPILHPSSVGAPTRLACALSGSTHVPGLLPPRLLPPGPPVPCTVRAGFVAVLRLPAALLAALFVIRRMAGTGCDTARTECERCLAAHARAFSVRSVGARQPLVDARAASTPTRALTSCAGSRPRKVTLLALPTRYAAAPSARSRRGRSSDGRPRPCRWWHPCRGFNGGPSFVAKRQFSKKFLLCLPASVMHGRQGGAPRRERLGGTTMCACSLT